MIQLHTDCLVFETSDGEAIPCSAKDVTIELLGEAARHIEPHVIQEAAAAALHFFKIDKARTVVSVGEFTLALERILRGFGYKVAPTQTPEKPVPHHAETDLAHLAQQTGEGLEMVFFGVLRDNIHAHLHGKPSVLRVKGLRDAVKRLIGARRWGQRCQKLNDQIVDYLRNVALHHQRGAKFTLMIL
ncbi:MAG: hypothetical protein EXS22_07880 [Pedosphaera sp.]|nr:hypothetical protein [Pedosphaera sp.]MSU43941.1 hypothetical protein [Pedosphaera sp.]